jgi:hypothetical protein
MSKNTKVQGWNPQTEFVNKNLQIKEPNVNAGESDLIADEGTNTTIEGVYKSITKSNMEMRNQLSADDFPKAFCCSVTGSRRTGKTTVTESLLNEMQGGKEKRFDYVFLFSPTLSGFDSIPNNYKFQDLSILGSLIQRQQELTTWNKQALKKDHKKCSICIILDDMLGTGDLKNKLLMKIALNGRHINADDPVKGNELCTFLLSQSVTGIPKKIRQNIDVTIASRLNSKSDRQTLVEENMILDSSRGGIQRAYMIYDTATLERDYSFIAIMNHISNKNTYEKYVRSYVASIPKAQGKIRWFGGKGDWKVKKPTFDFV